MDLYAKKMAFETSAFWKALIFATKVLLIVTSISTTLLIFAGAVVRYVFKSNFFGVEEIIVMVAFWLYFVGGVYGSYEKSHIKADMVNIYVKNIRLRDTLNILAQLVSAFVCIVFTKWAVDYIMFDIAMMPRTSGLKLPLLIPHSAICLGYVLMTFYQLYYLIINLTLFLKGVPLDKLQGDVETTDKNTGGDE